MGLPSPHKTALRRSITFAKRLAAKPALYIGAAALCGTGVIAVPAYAGQDVELSRAVYVEKTSRSSQGMTRELKPAKQIRVGDKLVLMLEWRAPGKAKGFTISSRIPPGLAFQRASSDAIEVSVDGGKKWGKLGTIRKGRRLATPEDVTNLRWAVPARSAAKGKGRLTFSALVKR